MKFSCWTRQLAFVAIAVAIFTIGNDSCVAQGGGSWGGSWGGGSGGSMGSAGGSWGGQRVFRTPVRSFFAHHQPARRLFGGFGSQGSAGGSAGFASAGNGSVGFSSAGSMGSAGSVGSGSAGGFGSAGYQYYSGGGYASGGSAGFVSAPTSNFSVGATFPSAADCSDCFVGTSNGLQHGAVSNSSAPIPYSETGYFGGDAGVINNSGVVPAEQYYDSSGNVIPNAGSTLESGNSSGLEKPPTPEPAKNGETTTIFRQDGAAILNVAVPVNAKVLINNRLTTTGGSSRSFVSRHLQAGRDYSFEVEAIVERDGRDVTLQQQVVMRAGRSQSVNFDFDSPVLTQVTLKVPENASIKLCGNDTTVSGSVRNFKTRLMPGQVWENYDIDVSYEKDGQIVAKRQTITIEAGQKYIVDFEFGKDLYVSK